MKYSRKVDEIWLGTTCRNDYLERETEEILEREKNTTATQKWENKNKRKLKIFLLFHYLKDLKTQQQDYSINLILFSTRFFIESFIFCCPPFILLAEVFKNSNQELKIWYYLVDSILSLSKMMDRNREARRAAAMVNGLPKRRHRTATGASLRESTGLDLKPFLFWTLFCRIYRINF